MATHLFTDHYRLPESGRALAVALLFAKRYDDSNPDVGMGPSLEELLNDVLDMADIDYLDAPTKARIVEAVRRKL